MMPPRVSSQRRNTYVIVEYDQLQALTSLAVDGIQRMGRNMGGQSAGGTITVNVRELPEGVWLASSDDIPGLIVEADTRESVIDLAGDLAEEILREGGTKFFLSERPVLAFVFSTS